MVVVRSAAEAEGLLEVVVATTAHAGTTQTRALKPMHQEVAEVMVLAEVVVVVSGVAGVDVAMEVDAVDATTSDMTPAAEGEGFTDLGCNDAQP